MAATLHEDDASLSARAAWLYFAGGLTQRQIATRLGVPSSKAHRLVARATRDGLVRVIVDPNVAACVELEEALTDAYGLGFCRVVPDADEAGMPLRTLGAAGGAYLRNVLEYGSHATVGIGHGRTVAAAVDALPTTPVSGTRFVSLLGGLTRRFAANPFDVIHRLAEKTGADAYFLPVPLFANTASDRDVLLSQVGVNAVLEMAREATLLVAGLGEVGDQSHLHETGMVTEEELAELRDSGAKGELLGHYFDADGHHVDVSLHARSMSLGIEELRGRNTVGIAGGLDKVDAVRAVLRSGLLHGLITDEATARGIVGRQAASASLPASRHDRTSRTKPT